MIHASADENPHQGYHSMLLSACEEYRAKVDKLEAENLAMRNEIAWLNSQTMWVCACGGTDCAGQKENAALREALREIADASGFDNIGNWARNKAKDALRKKGEPMRADHSGDINEMMQAKKEAQP